MDITSISQSKRLSWKRKASLRSSTNLQGNLYNLQSNCYQTKSQTLAIVIPCRSRIACYGFLDHLIPSQGRTKLKSFRGGTVSGLELNHYCQDCMFTYNVKKSRKYSRSITIHQSNSACTGDPTKVFN